MSNADRRLWGYQSALLPPHNSRSFHLVRYSKGSAPPPQLPAILLSHACCALMYSSSSSRRRQRRPSTRFTVHSDADDDDQVDDVDSGPTVQAVHVSLRPRGKRPTVTLNNVPTQTPRAPSVVKDTVTSHPQENTKPKTKTRVVSPGFKLS